MKTTLEKIAKGKSSYNTRELTREEKDHEQSQERGYIFLNPKKLRQCK